MSSQTGLTTDQVEQFIDIIDQALQSDAPAVVQALQNLILITSLTAEKSLNKGPIGQLVEDLRVLQARVSRLEEDMKFNQAVQQKNHWEKYAPTWPYTVTSTTSSSSANTRSYNADEKEYARAILTSLESKLR